MAFMSTIRRSRMDLFNWRGSANPAVLVTRHGPSTRQGVCLGPAVGIPEEIQDFPQSYEYNVP